MKTNGIAGNRNFVMKLCRLSPFAKPYPIPKISLGSGIQKWAWRGNHFYLRASQTMAEEQLLSAIGSNASQRILRKFARRQS